MTDKEWSDSVKFNYTRVQTPACPKCKKISLVDLLTKDYKRWIGGEFIQNVFPTMTADKRELLMTGTHEKCWNEMWDDAGTAAVSLLQAIFKEDTDEKYDHDTRSQEG